MSTEGMNSELFKEYCANSEESLGNLEQDLLALEQDPENRDLLSSIFREMHTMKGNAGFMQFSKTERISHVAEDILSKIRDGEMGVDTAKISTFLLALDQLKLLQAHIVNNGGEPEAESEAYIAVINQLVQINEKQDEEASLKSNQYDEGDAGAGQLGGGAHADSSEQASPVNASSPASASLKAGEKRYEITVMFEPDEPMPGPRALMIIKNLKLIGRVNRLYPDVLADPPEAVEDRLVIVVSTDNELSQIERACDVSGVSHVDLQEQGQLEAPAKTAPPDASASKANGSKSEPLPGGPAVESTIRIETALLDSLMNQVGELVLARNQIMQLVREDDDSVRYTAPTQRLNLITSEIQDGIMKTRLQPIRNVWSRFPRIVRDMALSNGKEINIHMEGADTELDKTLIEAIKDPLTHIVRNSVDHGIETKEIRIERGKPQAGNIYLNAYHEGGQVNIEIKDDGAGINLNKLIKKSIEKQLITAEEAASLSDKEALNLIFAAGLSTADKITNISGRGVGMDVVKTNIEKIGGTVDLSSIEGEGTTLRIKIPLTLAIIPALLVNSGGEKFAIPQASLIELVRIDSEAGEHIEEIGGAKLYRLRGNLLPLIDLQRILYPNGIADKPAGDASSVNGAAHGLEESANIVVLNSASGSFGLIVDKINDTEEIVVKPLSSNLKMIPVYAGATILGDGTVALILEANGIAEMGQIALETHKKQLESDLNVPDESRLSSFLLFSIEGDDLYAVPLDMVDRLEEFNRTRIERSSGKNVIQYRNNILPLISLDQIMLNKPVQKEDNVIQCIVITRLNQSFGLIVNKIIDVLELETELQPAPDNPLLMGTAVIEERTTDIIDVYKIIQQEMPSWLNQRSSKAVGNPVMTKALLFEPSKFQSDLLQQYLDQNYIDVTVSQSTQEFMNLAIKQEVDVILLDVDNPKTNGMALVKSIKANAPGASTPVIALTSKLNEHLVEEAKEAGFAECVLKMDRESVKAAIDETSKK